MIRIPIGRAADVFDARFHARELALRLGFSRFDATAVETAVSELAGNIYRHAGRGVVVLKAVPDTPPPHGLEVTARNAPAPAPGATPAGRAEAGVRQLPGEDVATRRPSGLGIGLPGVFRLMDETHVGQAEDGTFLVVTRKYLPGRLPQRQAQPMAQVDVSERFRVEVATRALRPGASGDGYLVRELEHGHLVAVVADVLGHGSEAADVARSLERITKASLHLTDPGELVARLNEGLRYTRGACALVVSVAPGRRQLQWSGAGNVVGRLWAARAPGATHLMPPPGVLGYNVHRVERFALAVAPPALLVLATDGIDEEALSRRPHHAMDLLERSRRRRDDATAVLIAWE